MDHSGRSADSGGRLTVPKTPNFETRRRLRPNRAVSQTEREEMELQEAKKWVGLFLGLCTVVFVVVCDFINHCVAVTDLL